MSNAELYPLFPSATHPAIPIAARILSTLRNLTGPGKGNDLKPEERAALVGISALLGCEKYASHIYFIVTIHTHPPRHHQQPVLVMNMGASLFLDDP